MVILSPTTVGIAAFRAYKTIFPFQLLQKTETALFIWKDVLELPQVLLCQFDRKLFYFFYLVQT
jgi:hypothetical protein